MVFPVAYDSPGAEARHLLFDGLVRELPGGLADLDGVDAVAALPARRLERLQLDGQPMAVPAGNVADPSSLRELRPADDVLDDLVERVPDMQIAVRVRRPVVQHERLSARSLPPLPRIQLIGAFGEESGDVRCRRPWREFRSWKSERAFQVFGRIFGRLCHGPAGDTSACIPGFRSLNRD